MITRKALTVSSHFFLIIGVLIVAFPIYMAFVISTHSLKDVYQTPAPVLPGQYLVENYSEAWNNGAGSSNASATVTVRRMLINSGIMAFGIATGKIVISLLAAFAIVYFKFRFRKLAFWLIFMTLMLPVEVRILPTYEITAQLGLINTYAGLIIPLIASATATFMFRQVFMAIPDELTEAAMIDGVGPMRFFWDILIPIARTNIAAMFVILFIYGWTQYLWPLMITTDQDLTTIIIGINQMLFVDNDQPPWHLIMATTIYAIIPPALVVIFMQKLFVRGLVETEK